MVSGELSELLALPFVLAAARQALAQATPVLGNQDPGSHFTSPAYLALLEDAGVRISMDGRGWALDNVFTERFWRSVKYEEVYLNEYRSPREARQGVARYISVAEATSDWQSLDPPRPEHQRHGAGTRATWPGRLLASRAPRAVGPIPMPQTKEAGYASSSGYNRLKGGGSMVQRIHDGDLATRLRAATVEGEVIVEAGSDQYLVLRLPRTVEVTDPDEIALVLEAAADSGGLRYTAEEALALLRQEVASGQ